MTLQELAEAIGAVLTGEAGEAEVLGLTSLDDMAPGYVVYVADEKRLAEAEAGPALAVIAPPSATPSGKPLLQVANPRLAFARALACLYPARRLPPGVHPKARLGKGVQVGEGAAIGPYCVVGDGAVIGPHTQLHPFVSLGAGVELGPDCDLHPHVTVYDDVRLGARVVVQAGAVIGSQGFGYVFDGEKHVPIPQVGTVIVEDDVEIGANTTIDRATLGATVIGAGSKLDNLVHIAHNVTLGPRCLFAAQVGLAGSVTVGSDVVMGGQAGVADHLTIGSQVGVGGGAAIIQNVPSNCIVYGQPARPSQEQLRIDASLRKLPDLVRTVRELTKRIEELERGTSSPTDSDPG